MVQNAPMKARIFIGIPVPPAIRKQLAALPHDIAGAKWSDSANYHLTLAFIGETERDAIDRICEALRRVEAMQFPLAIHGVGRFDTRILWAGVTSHAHLHGLQGRVRAALDGIGIDYDHRPYRPHVTMARLKSGLDETQLQAWMQEHAALASHSFLVEHFHLYESASTPAGVRYEPLATFSLSAA